MSLQKKVDSITRKIEELKSQQQKIETDIAQQLISIIKSQSGFTLPFDALVGGLIEVINLCKTDQTKLEEWQHAGRKFLKSHGRGGNKNSNKIAAQKSKKSDATKVANSTTNLG